MSTLIENIKKSANFLLTNNGVNPDALFQTHNRRIKYPGNNLFFIYSESYLGDPSGVEVVAPIHTDTVASVNSQGNFSINNYIQVINQNRINLQEIFSDYPERDPPIIINEDSFLNRRLRAGMNVKEETTKTFTRPSYRKPIITLLDEEEEEEEEESI